MGPCVYRDFACPLLYRSAWALVCTGILHALFFIGVHGPLCVQGFCMPSSILQTCSEDVRLSVPFLYGVDAKKGMLSQHFVMHVVPLLGACYFYWVTCPSYLKVGDQLALSGHPLCETNIS